MTRITRILCVWCVSRHIRGQQEKTNKPNERKRVCCGKARNLGLHREMVGSSMYQRPPGRMPLLIQTLPSNPTTSPRQNMWTSVSVTCLFRGGETSAVVFLWCSRGHLIPFGTLNASFFFLKMRHKAENGAKRCESEGLSLIYVGDEKSLFAKTARNKSSLYRSFNG